jgi:hypothetical protein
MLIYLVTDYKGNFGSKVASHPYRSGFDKGLISTFFQQKGFEVEFINANVSHEKLNLNGSIVLYTSQEDNGLYYKSYLEDYLYYLTLCGARIIPMYELLKAHENKVFFEMLRKTNNSSNLRNLTSWWFGSYEEFVSESESLPYPIVIKSYYGSMSRGVYLANTRIAAIKRVKKISKSGNPFLKYWDLIRFHKHKGYLKESWNRKKFVIQEFISGLLNDYKILIYGRKYYVLRRANKNGDFRASGQGNLSFIKDLPEGLLDFAEKCFLIFNSPQASFDIGFNNKQFYLFEAQFVYFGTYTIESSDFYFIKENENWICVDGKSILEEEYVNSVVEFIAG